MQPRTILVVNSKGGSGKTTVSINIASYYVTNGTPTVLVDLDRQRSSMRWLERRPQANPTIEKMSGWDNRRYPVGTELVVMDAPAQIQRQDLLKLVSRADVVIVPVLPSPIDIDAAAEFIGVLLIHAKIRIARTPVGVVANRVKANTLIYARLLRFLKTLRIPFVTSIRDTQNYIHAAEQGLGIFEMRPSIVKKDIEQWQALIAWIEAGTERFGKMRAQA